MSWLQTSYLLKTIYALYMHVHTSEVVISQCNSIANNEKPPPPPQFDETIPGRVSSFWTHQQGLSRHDQKPKSHICNNKKNLVSIYYKFLRTHHTRSACYHFGTGIPSVSKMQYTTQRVYSKRDLFETLTSITSMIACAARVMCAKEFVID